MTISRISPVKRRLALAVSATLLLGANHRLLAADSSEAVLLQELKKRDAVIAQLLKRVEKLEDQVQDTVVWVGSQPDGPIMMRQIDELQSQLEVLTGEQLKQGDQVAGADGTKRSRGPGAVDVDEFAADRALERTLTTQGALLLPKGVYEIAPFFSYARNEADGFLATTLGLGGGSTLAVSTGTRRIKRDEFNFGANIRIGLPYESQLEIGVPYRVVNQEVVSSPFSGARSASDDTGSSIGDISIGLAKTLVREKEWKPDLIGRITWDSDSSDLEDNGINLGGGFNEYRVSLTALKRQDPLAFTGAFSYTMSEERSVNGSDVKPGDQIALSLGASLAASPSTSLSFNLAQTWSQDTEVNGSSIDGSSVTSSQLLIGASSSLGRQTLLSLTAGIGLTDDAPDYSFLLSLPVRFY